MKKPRLINTLTEAAKWMTESTRVEWTSESLLDFICEQMHIEFSAIRSEYKDDCSEEDFKKITERFSTLSQISYCLKIALPPTTRVVERVRNVNGGVKQRRYGRGKTPLLSLNHFEHIYSLLAHGSIELPYPLTSEPWDGINCIDAIDADTAPIITPDSLRICEDDLFYLFTISGKTNTCQIRNF